MKSLRIVTVVFALLATCVLAQEKARATKLSARLHELATAVPITVAHRGDSRTCPENTVPAFRAAVSAGAAMVELDFRQTSDGVLVCLHDATVDRTTDGVQKLRRKKIAVDTLTLAQVQSLDAGAWKHARFAGTRIPTLEAALQVIQKGSVAMIEHKAGDPEALVKLLRRMRLVEDVLVQSFDWNFLERVHRLEPKITTAALGSKPIDRKQLEAVSRTGASMLHWSAKQWTVEQVERAQKLGYLLVGYTLNSDLEFVGAAGLGLHAITTDRPTRLRSLTSMGVVERAR